MNLQACSSPRCSPGAREVGRDGLDHPPRLRFRFERLSLNTRHAKKPNSKGNPRTGFVRSLNYTGDNTMDRGGTHAMCYNIFYSTQRVFQALRLRLATPSATSSSPRSISFVILPMAIVLPVHASEIVWSGSDGRRIRLPSSLSVNLPS